MRGVKPMRFSRVAVPGITSGLISGRPREFDFPQGLKPSVYGTRSGTAEAVPLQITFMRPVLVFPPFARGDEGLNTDMMDRSWFEERKA
jgi:hypothetical protein